MSSHSHSDVDDEEDGGFTAGDLVGMLRRRWPLILVSTLIVGALAGLLALALPSKYEAAATVQIDPRKKTILSVENVVADLKTDTATVESEVEIIRSRPLVLKVVEQLRLREHPEFSGPSLFGRLRGMLGLAPASEPARSDALAALIERDGAPPAAEPRGDEVAQAFDQRLKVARVRNTLLIEIRFTAADPTLASRAVNALAEAYLTEQVEAKTRATEEAAGLLEAKLDGLRRKVADAERKVAQYKAENNIFDSEGQLLSEKQMARLMEQTVMARNRTAEAKARFDQLAQVTRTGNGSTAVADVLQSNTVRMLKDQLVNATRHEAELATKYGPRHPELIKAHAQVSDVQAKLKAEVDQIVANMRNEYLVAEERERVLADNLGSLKSQQVTTKEASVELRELEREAQTSRQLFETVLARYKQTTETQDLQVTDSRIVERADVPISPSAPKRKQIAAFGIIVGLVAGFGLAFLMELRNPGFVRPEDIETTLGLPHLASVPLLARPNAGEGDPRQAAHLVIARPDGVFADAIFSARREIERRRRDPGPRIILVASTLPNEGRTLLATNLAYHFARSGTRTLLVDADLRRSMLSQQLGIDAAPGLLEAVEHGASFETVLLRDADTGLAVLPAGGAATSRRSPAEILDAPGFGQRMTRLKSHFDTIIIDAPPLLPVVDARLLAEHADQILLVTAWRRTPKQLVRRGLKLLGSNADKLVGVVVNQVESTETMPARDGMRAAASDLPQWRAAA